MRWRPVVLFVLFVAGTAFFACESDVSKGRDGDEETVCVTSHDQIDFGQVAVGEYRDTCLTIGVDAEDGHIADTKKSIKHWLSPPPCPKRYVRTISSLLSVA